PAAFRITGTAAPLGRYILVGGTPCFQARTAPRFPSHSATRSTRGRERYAELPHALSRAERGKRRRAIMKIQSVRSLHRLPFLRAEMHLLQFRQWSISARVGSSLSSCVGARDSRASMGLD